MGAQSIGLLFCIQTSMTRALYHCIMSFILATFHFFNPPYFSGKKIVLIHLENEIGMTKCSHTCINIQHCTCFIINF